MTARFVMISASSLGSVRDLINIEYGVGGKELGEFKLRLGFGIGKNKLPGSILLNPPSHSRVSAVRLGRGSHE